MLENQHIITSNRQFSFLYKALLKYVSQVHQGVRGVVKDSRTHQPIRTSGLKIVGRDSYFRTTPRGEFWRILLPGTYQLQASNVYTLTKLNLDWKKQ